MFYIHTMDAMVAAPKFGGTARHAVTGAAGDGETTAKSHLQSQADPLKHSKWW